MASLQKMVERSEILWEFKNVISDRIADFFIYFISFLSAAGHHYHEFKVVQKKKTMLVLIEGH